MITLPLTPRVTVLVVYEPEKRLLRRYAGRVHEPPVTFEIQGEHYAEEIVELIDRLRREPRQFMPGPEAA